MPLATPGELLTVWTSGGPKICIWTLWIPTWEIRRIATTRIRLMVSLLKRTINFSHPFLQRCNNLCLRFTPPATYLRNEQILNSMSTIGNVDVYFNCDEGQACSSGARTTLANESNGDFSNYYITFCPAFFKTKEPVPSLWTTVNALKSNGLSPRVLNNIAVPRGNQAKTFYHALL